MKDLDLAIARMYGLSALSTNSASNGPPTHHHIRQRLYQRHRSLDRRQIDEQRPTLEHVQTEKESGSSEDNNNIQSCSGATASSVKTNSVISADQRSASSGSISTATTVHLVNGHYKSSQRQLSPLLSGCRRKLYLHFNKTLRAAKSHWTSPSVSNEKPKSKKPYFLRRKKSDQNRAYSTDIEERPSSISGPSEDGLATPPPSLIPRSPSAGHIDCLNLAPLDLALRGDQQHADSDEHHLIAYNSSLLMANHLSGPVQQPYQIDNANGSGAVPTSSYANSENRILNLDNKETTENNERNGRSYQTYDLAEETNIGESSADQTDQEVNTCNSNPNGDHINDEIDANVTAVDTSTIVLEKFHNTHNRTCTSFRIKIPPLKNPVDACLLPDDCTAIADYDNGLLILNAFGEIIQHRKSSHEINACGVTCSRSLDRLLLLIVRDGTWSINIYNYNFMLLDTARCPTDPLIENWALRRLVVSLDSRLHLLASGENKSCIWTYEMDKREWKTVLVEISGRKMGGNYNDMSVRYNLTTKETRILLCEWKKAQLWSLVINEKGAVIEQRSIKMKRVKGQEWIVQGPHLATLDEQGDIVVYDGSGKLFLFDGDTYKCKKIIADVGRGEVSALVVMDGWVYALCRYRLCFEAYLYREQVETNL